MTDEAPREFDPAFWRQHWDETSSRAGMATAPPNPYVLKEAVSHSPGTALEVGCGAGAEAIALAASGWEVTAVDTAAQALLLGAERASSVTLTGSINWLQDDVTSWDPGSTYDLVTCSYVHTPLQQPALLKRLAGWVAPGGILLMVGHGEGHHDHHDDGECGERPPAEALNDVNVLSAALEEWAWRVNTEQHSRAVGSTGGQQKVLYDVVLRAQRRK